MDTTRIRELIDKVDVAREKVTRLVAAVDEYNAAVDELDDAEGELRGILGPKKGRPTKTPRGTAVLNVVPDGDGEAPRATAQNSDGFFANAKYRRYEGTLKGEVLRVLSETGKPVGREEIFAYVMRANKNTTTGSIAQAIKLLHSDDKLIKRPARGHYQLPAAKG